MERSQKLGLQIKAIETHCNIEFLLTTEGLYVAPLVKNLPMLDSFVSFADTRGLIDLSLADEELIEEERRILTRECNLFVS
jgi:hypothetical protein